MRDTLALREVISDYFCQPASDNKSDSDSSSTDTDSEASASALALPEPVVVVDVLRDSPVATTSTAQPVPTHRVGFTSYKLNNNYIMLL